LSFFSVFGLFLSVFLKKCDVFGEKVQLSVAPFGDSARSGLRLLISFPEKWDSPLLIPPRAESRRLGSALRSDAALRKATQRHEKFLIANCADFTNFIDFYSFFSVFMLFLYVFFQKCANFGEKLRSGAGIFAALRRYATLSLVFSGVSPGFLLPTCWS
jgi:hypothetical protein